MKISRTLETIASIPWFQGEDLEVTPAERARRAFNVRLLQAGHKSADEPVEAAPLRGNPEDFVTSGGGRGRKG